MITDPQPLSGGDDLYEKIAEKAGGQDPARVEELLGALGINLTAPFPAHRELLVRYLYCDGTKNVEGSEVPYTFEAPFGPGAWAIASTVNLDPSAWSAG